MIPRQENSAAESVAAARSQISRRVRPKQPIADPQRPLQFEVRPVIERIAERFGNGPGPLLELLPVRGVASDVALGDAGGTHRAPLVVIAVEPDLRKVLEATVRGDLLRGKVGMIVDDRQVAGVLVIQLNGAIVLEEEVLRDEDVAHGSSPDATRNCKRQGAAGDCPDFRPTKMGLSPSRRSEHLAVPFGAAKGQPPAASTRAPFHATTKNPAARGKAKRRGRNREEATLLILR